MEKQQIMTIDDIDFDDEPQTVGDPNEGVNNLLHIIHDEERVGCGFIIQEDGLFISVGHNFKRLDPKIPETGIDRYAALFGNKVYAIVPLLMEYNPDIDNNPGETYEDLFIGRLKDFDRQASLKPFLPLAEGHPSGTVNVEGYKLVQYMASKAFLTDYGYAKYFNLPLKVSEEAIIPEYQRYSNLFYLPQLDEHWRGLSGGPVYADGKIYGTLQGRMFITSPYILSCLHKCGIDHN